MDDNLGMSTSASTNAKSLLLGGLKDPAPMFGTPQTPALPEAAIAAAEKEEAYVSPRSDYSYSMALGTSAFRRPPQAGEELVLLPHFNDAVRLNEPLDPKIDLTNPLLPNTVREREEILLKMHEPRSRLEEMALGFWSDYKDFATDSKVNTGLETLFNLKNKPYPAVVGLTDTLSYRAAIYPPFITSLNYAVPGLSTVLRFSGRLTDVKLHEETPAEALERSIQKIENDDLAANFRDSETYANAFVQAFPNNFPKLKDPETRTFVAQRMSLFFGPVGLSFDFGHWLGFGTQDQGDDIIRHPVYFGQGEDKRTIYPDMARQFGFFPKRGDNFFSGDIFVTENLGSDVHLGTGYEWSFRDYPFGENPVTGEELHKDHWKLVDFNISAGS